MSTLQEQPPTVQEMEALIFRLRSPFIGERTEAEQALQHLSPAAVDVLLALITRESRKLSRRRRIYFGLVAAFCLTILPAAIYCLVMSIILGAHGDPHGTAYAGAVGGLLGGGGGGLLGGFAWLLTPTPMQYYASETLARIEDPRAVGALAHALEIQPVSVASTKALAHFRSVSRWPGFRATSFTADLRYSAAAALMKLLPRLGLGDAELLDRDQRACLHRALLRCDRDKETQFMIVVIHALERIGDTGAISTLQRLAQARTATAPQQAVQTAARTAVEALQDRLKQTRHAETLVRPAASPGASDSTLLRPVHGSSENDPDLLLRAAAGTETADDR